MNATVAKQKVDYIVKDVFGVDNPFSLLEFQQKFAFDIPRVSKRTCALSHKDTWIASSLDGKIASQAAIEERFKQDGWIPRNKIITSVADILKAWDEINYQTGEKYINSTNVSESDGIYTSNNVYQSVSVFDSKDIVFSYELIDCSYMTASRDNASCTLGIRVKESIYCSSSFEVSWSNKVSKSMFIHDGYDLYECLFCSHIRSKKFCIANMQFEKDEYFRLKKEVIRWILESGTI